MTQTCTIIAGKQVLNFHKNTVPSPSGRLVVLEDTTVLRNVGSYLHVTRYNIPEVSNN